MGILRLYLAATVVAWHGGGPTNWMPYSFVAVFCFYIISGFYMSLVISEKYSSTPNGTARFYLNRILRIYPTYLAVLLLHLVLLAPETPTFSSIANQALLLPATVWRNLTLQLGPDGNPLAVGQFYTVGLELMFYAIAPFVVLRSTRALASMWWLALAIHFAPVLFGADPRAWQYDFFPSTLVFFFSGCLAYRLYRSINEWRYPDWLGYLLLPAFPMFCLNVSGRMFTNQSTPILLYCLLTLTLPFLFRASRRSALDRFCGDLSYPIYAVHLTVIALVEQFRWQNVASTTVLTIGITASLALVLVVFLERPIDRFRHSLSARGVFMRRLAWD